MREPHCKIVTIYGSIEPLQAYLGCDGQQPLRTVGIYPLVIDGIYIREALLKV